MENQRNILLTGGAGFFGDILRGGSIYAEVSATSPA
jgi:hypothetical protein